MNGDWKYVGEGGKHALFEIPSLSGKLLRIEKEFLRQAEYNTDRPTQVPEPTLSNRYIESIVAPLLAPYVDIPEVVVLEWGLLRTLRKTTLEAGVIPLSRVQDWESGNDSPSKQGSLQPIGMLVVDYRSIPQSLTVPFIGTTPPRNISVELKPKAGFLSRSPLVDPRHRAKFSKSRFSLLQMLHQQGLVEKGWAKTAEGVRKSDYEPLDLFSSDPTRISQAIQHLIATPQNNFRMWYNNRSMTSDGKLNTSEMSVLLKDVTGVEHSSKDDRESSFVSFVTELLLVPLTHESLLMKLRTLQKLDALDADGASIVSERLLELCEGSRQAAEQCLSEWTRPRCDRQGAVHELFEHSPFQVPEGTADLLELCGAIEDFHAVMAGSYPDLPSKPGLDEFHSHATQLVARLSKEECAFLLANRLLSLAMCDVSIFLTFEQLAVSSPLATSESPSFAVDNQFPGSTNRVDMAHSDGRGTVVLTQHDGSTIRFAYMVRLIDCDEKPPGKIWRREAAFANLSINP
jgi:inositol-pentakisphosphate 2-kinase